MDPVTIAIISGVTTALGAVMAGGAASAQAQAQANAQRYNAQVQENNAKMARDQAAAKEEQQRRHFAQVQGRAIAGAAQSGAGMEGSSNADIIEQNAVNNELDALTIRYEGQVRAQGNESQAALSRYGANVSDMNASSAMMGGFIKAGTGLLTGYSNYQYGSGGYDKSGEK